jgi:hypothetical protein
LFSSSESASKKQRQTLPSPSKGLEEPAPASPVAGPSKGEPEKPRTSSQRKKPSKAKVVKESKAEEVVEESKAEEVVEESKAEEVVEEISLEGVPVMIPISADVDLGELADDYVQSIVTEEYDTETSTAKGNFPFSSRIQFSNYLPFLVN